MSYKVLDILAYKSGASDKIYGHAVAFGSHFVFYGRRCGPSRFTVINLEDNAAYNKMSEKRSKGYMASSIYDVDEFHERMDRTIIHNALLK